MKEKIRQEARDQLMFRIPLSELELPVEAFDLLLGHRQPHLVPLLDYHLDGEDLILIEPLLYGKTLLELLKESQAEKKEFSRENLARWYDEISTALHYLHSFRPSYLVHGDVQPANILIDEDGAAWLLDFSSCKLVSGSNQFFYRIHGRSEFTDPRYFSDGIYDRDSDLYGLQTTFQWVRKHMGQDNSEEKDYS